MNENLFFEAQEETVAPTSASSLFQHGALGGIDEAIEDELGADVRKLVLGSVCWWSLHNVNVEYQQFKDLMIGNGIPAEWVHPRHTNRDALITSLRDIHSNSDWPVEIKKISLGTKDGKEPAVHAIEQVHIDKENRRVHHNQIGTTLFNNATGSFAIEWNFNDPNALGFLPADLESTIIGMIQHRINHFDSTDVRHNVLDVIRKIDGFRVRPSGGIYFVPAKYANILSALNNIIVEVSDANAITGGDASGLFQLEVLDSAKAKTTLMISYGQYLESEIKRLSEGLSDAEKGDRNIRTSTLHERLEELKTLQDRAKRYATMFDMQVERLNTALQETGTRILSLVGSK